MAPARTATLLLAAAAALAGLAGCGEERGDATRTAPVAASPPSRPPPGAVSVAQVSLSDYELPAVERLPRPGLVAFEATNDGRADHALAVDGPKGQVRTRTLVPGERAAVAVRLPAGTYKWYCPLGDHERRGMVGRVRVAE